LTFAGPQSGAEPPAIESVGWTVQSRAWRLTQMPSADSSARAVPPVDHVGPAIPASWPVAQPANAFGTAGVPERTSGLGYQIRWVLSP
jgi:hypothetical protein